MERFFFEWEPTEQEIQWFNDMSIRTKDQLLSKIAERRQIVKTTSETDNKHSAAYYTVLDGLFQRLLDEVEGILLFEKLEDFWAYTFAISSEGAKVTLEHYGYVTFDEEGNNTSIIDNAKYDLVFIPCKMLTVEEYSQKYGVESVTVRQWIRRGKIRSAKKYGSEWRISELTDKPGRGYTYGSYEWNDELSGISEEYKYLREPAKARFAQDENNPKMYYMWLERDKTIGKRYDLTQKEREKIELMLISHPMVKNIPIDYPTWC